MNITQVTSPIKLIQLVGAPKGDIDILYQILTAAVEKYPELKMAYAAVVKLRPEEEPSLALILDSPSKHKKNIEILAKFCFENIGKISIFFWSDLPEKFSTEIKTQIKPFLKK